MRHVCASKTLGSNVIINGIDMGDSVEILVVSSIKFLHHVNVTMKFRHP